MLKPGIFITGAGKKLTYSKPVSVAYFFSAAAKLVVNCFLSSFPPTGVVESN